MDYLLRSKLCLDINLMSHDITFPNDCYSKKARWLLFESCTNQIYPHSNHDLTLNEILGFNYFLINYYAIPI